MGDRVTSVSNKVALKVSETLSLTPLTSPLIVLKNQPLTLPIFTSNADPKNINCKLNNKPTSVCQKDGRILCNLDSGSEIGGTVVALVNNQTVKTVSITTLDFTVVRSSPKSIQNGLEASLKIDLRYFILQPLNDFFVCKFETQYEVKRTPLSHKGDFGVNCSIPQFNLFKKNMIKAVITIESVSGKDNLVTSSVAL